MSLKQASRFRRRRHRHHYRRWPLIPRCVDDETPKLETRAHGEKDTSAEISVVHDFDLSVLGMNLSANTGPSGASAAAGAVDPHLHRRAIVRPAPDSCLTTALHRILAAQ